MGLSEPKYWWWGCYLEVVMNNGIGFQAGSVWDRSKMRQIKLYRLSLETVDGVLWMSQLQEHVQLWLVPMAYNLNGSIFSLIILGPNPPGSVPAQALLRWVNAICSLYCMRKHSFNGTSAGSPSGIFVPQEVTMSTFQPASRMCCLWRLPQHVLGAPLVLQSWGVTSKPPPTFLYLHGCQPIIMNYFSRTHTYQNSTFLAIG